MACAYAYANGDRPMPPEIRLAGAVERFGAQSIYGRPLGAKEIVRMETAEGVVNAFAARAHSADWANWAIANKSASEFLNRAMKYAINLGMTNVE